MSLFNRLKVLALLVVVCGAVVACGDSPTDPNPPPAPTAQPSYLAVIGFTDTSPEFSFGDEKGWLVQVRNGGVQDNVVLLHFWFHHPASNLDPEIAENIAMNVDLDGGHFRAIYNDGYRTFTTLGIVLEDQKIAIEAIYKLYNK